MKNKKRNRLISGLRAALFSAVLAFILFPATGHAMEMEDGLRVTFVDVGHGDAVLVSSSGQHLLIDAGEAPGTDHLTDYLEEEGIEHLNWLLVTHEHSDHIGGVMQVMDSVDVWNILHAIEEPGEEMERIGLEAWRNGTNIRRVYRGDSFHIGDATAYVIGPYSDYPGDENNMSVILRVVYGDTSFLFMGDAEEEEEEELLDAGYELSSDVLKVGHHGAVYSTSEEFLDEAQPDYAVICSRDDQEGYPAESIVDRLEESGAEVLITGRDGDITFYSDGDEVQIMW